MSRCPHSYINTYAPRRRSMRLALDTGALPSVSMESIEVPMTDVLRDVYEAQNEFYRDSMWKAEVLVLGWKQAVRIAHLMQCDGSMYVVGYEPSKRYGLFRIFDLEVVVDAGPDPDRISVLPAAERMIDWAMACSHAVEQPRTPAEKRIEIVTIDPERPGDAPVTADRPVLCPACLRPVTRWEALGIANHDCPNWKGKKR